jgi:hypothetical protein
MNRTLFANAYRHSRQLRQSYPCRAILRLCLAGLTALIASPNQILAQISVLTANGDNNRTNANVRESHLTPQNVRPGSFGKLGSFPADGQIYAQPLYVSNLAFPNGATHNVLFITTMHNTVYAYDADVPSVAGLLWQVNLGQPFPPSLWNAAYTDISPEVGILGTGAIDLAAGVLYVVAETLQNGAAVFSLHALDLLTGAERMNGPVAITAQVSGSGAGSVGGVMQFDPGQHLQRPGLLLSNGAVYVAFGSHMDQSPWHGWVMSYDASDLTAQPGVFLTTPNGEGGAVWQSGRGLAADDVGGVYSMTGNGDFDGAGDFGESFVKLSGTNAALADWFTPANWRTLSAVDADLSTGPAVIPGTHQIVGGDKYGQLYLLNGDSMGKLGSLDADDGPVFSGAVIGGMFNFALWNWPGTTNIYVQGYQDVVKSYQITGGELNMTPVSSGSTPVAAPRVGMTISANGARNGILWETTGDFTAPSVPGTLHAFDAMNLSDELWNSGEDASEDSLGGFAKFANPTVVNGKVYVATSSGAVVAYGSICTNGVPSPAPACTGLHCPVGRLPLRAAGRCLTSQAGSPSLAEK